MTHAMRRIAPPVMKILVSSFAVMTLAFTLGCRKPKQNEPAAAPKRDTAPRLRGTFITDSGMTCLWDPSAFADVRDYDSWEAKLLKDDDITRHIESGAFVPINIGSDGAYEIEVRVGAADNPAVLSAREAKYLVAESEPYLFRSTGRLCVSGIEHVDGKPGKNVGALSLPAGDYAVKLHLIGWDCEPGMTNDGGTPKEGALPDFVALVNPRPPGATGFRLKLQTFPSPGN